MAFRSKLVSSLTLVFAIGSFSVFVSAQDASPAPGDDTAKAEKRERRGAGRRDGQGRPGMKHGRMGRQGGIGFLRGIELTDAQKEQIKAIHEANKPTQESMEQMKALRDARRGGGTVTEEQKAQMKQMREAQRAKMASVHEQILAILTPEQKAQIEQRKAEMKKRGEEFRQKRQQKIEAKPSDNN